MYPVSIHNSIHYPPSTIQQYYQNAYHLMQKQQWHEAACLLNYIIIHYPNLSAAKYQLASCQMQLEFWEGAQYHLHSILDNKNPDPDVLCNLAIIYWQTKQIKSALRFFHYTLKYFPYHKNTRQNLASFYLKFNRINKAIIHYQAILNHNSKDTEIRFNLASCLQKQGIYDEAILHYKIILQQYQKHYDSMYNLGCIYYILKDFKASKFYWSSCLSMNPNHHALLFMYQQIQNQPISNTHHQAYIKDLFDHYAEFYEPHMQKTLQYQLPMFLKNYFKETFSEHRLRCALDIGCGTGLCGTAISSVTQHLIGIDVSPNMLEKAKLKNVYHELNVIDCLSFLNETNQMFDLIIAMDVTPYLQNFETILKNTALHLHQKGHLIFSIECTHEENVKLEANGRISYSSNYIESICKDLNLELIHSEHFTARLEQEIPVIERIYHWKKA
jgi:tetratricopeptide (TPR) repeat protein